MTTLTEPPHVAIASRRRRGQTTDQLYSVGERTGWWTVDDVDWVDSGGQGPRPDGWTLDDPDPATAVGLGLLREAVASAALDGDTYSLDDASIVGGGPSMSPSRRHPRSSR